MTMRSVALLAITSTATALAGPPVSYTEVAADLGIDVPHVLVDDFPGLKQVSPGGAAGDFDGDGWTDLFLVSAGTTPDYLLINDGKGGFTNEAAAWGLTQPHMGMGAAVGDYDGDGWLDIFVTSLGPAEGPAGPGHHRLYRNEAGTGFTEVAERAGVHRTSPTIRDGLGAAFGDFDLDGDLDLCVAGWAEGSLGNRLFENHGDGTFTDVTGVRITMPSGLRGFSPTFADMNGDRYPELLIAADYGTSKYFINEGGVSFRNDTVAAGLGLDDNGMGSAVADIDGDGRLDWYVSSIWTTRSAAPPIVSGTGNMLYYNQGDDTFVEVAQDLGAHDGGWGWGTVATDVDHDGRIDLIETNGWDLWSVPEFEGECIKLFHQQADGSFIDVAHECGLTHVQLGRGLIRLDYDNDGDQDLAVISHEGMLELYRCDATAGSWLRLFLDTSATPWLAPNGFGTRVTATVGATTFVRYLDGGCNYLTTSELSLHFGLGAARIVDELAVEWTDGRVTTLTDVPVDQTLTIAAPAVLGDLTGEGVVDALDQHALIESWGACAEPCPPSCPADLDADCTVGMRDLVLLLGAWSP
jgi:hypothetical protein